MKDRIKIEVVQGKPGLGNSLYINDYRVSGVKPYAGGRVVLSFDVDAKSVKEALKRHV